jgi:hypothetical protein
MTKCAVVCSLAFVLLFACDAKPPHKLQDLREWSSVNNTSTLNDAWFSNEVVSLEISSFEFHQVTFQGMSIASSVFEDISFIECAFHFVSLDNSTFSNVRFINSYIGADCVECVIDDVLISGSEVHWTNLTSSKIGRITVKNS